MIFEDFAGEHSLGFFSPRRLNSWFLGRALSEDCLFPFYFSFADFFFARSEDHQGLAHHLFFRFYAHLLFVPASPEVKICFFFTF